MGDYAIPCYTLAKKLRKNPAFIAVDMQKALDARGEELGIAKIEVVGAYCNIFLDWEMYAKECIEKLLEKNCGVSMPGVGRRSVWIIHLRILQRIFM